MPVIGVDKAQLVTYAAEAEGCFGNLNGALQSLVQDCVNVQYWGENATAFKGQTATAASSMAEEIGLAMKKFIKAVNDQTSAIARSLGGGDMTIDITPPSFSVPPIPAAEAGKQGADTGALEALQGLVNGHRDTVNAQVGEHESALGRTTEWTGNSKGVALSACTAFTNSVNTSVQTGIAKITGYITDQNAAVTSADMA